MGGADGPIRTSILGTLLNAQLSYLTLSSISLPKHKGIFHMKPSYL